MRRYDILPLRGRGGRSLPILWLRSLVNGRPLRGGQPQLTMLLLSPCLLPLHSPDGSLLFFEKENIVAVRPVAGTVAKQLPKGTQTVIYGSGGRNYAVKESPAEVADMIKNRCETH